MKLKQHYYKNRVVFFCIDELVWLFSNENNMLNLWPFCVCSHFGFSACFIIVNFWKNMTKQMNENVRRIFLFVISLVKWFIWRSDRALAIVISIIHVLLDLFRNMPERWFLSLSIHSCKMNHSSWLEISLFCSVLLQVFVNYNAQPEAIYSCQGSIGNECRDVCACFGACFSF